MFSDKPRTVAKMDFIVALIFAFYKLVILSFDKDKSGKQTQIIH